MFDAGGHNVDSCGVNTAVAKNVRQFGDVFFNAVEGSGKELAQVVGKTLDSLTPAVLHSCFICRQMLLRSRSFPLRLKKIVPARMFLLLA